jgi:hypothetical protein
LVPAKASGAAVGLARQQKREEYVAARKLRRQATKQKKREDKGAARIARREAKKRKQAARQQAREAAKGGKGKGKHSGKVGGKGTAKASGAGGRQCSAAGPVESDAGSRPSRRFEDENSSGEGGSRRRGPPPSAEVRLHSAARSPSGTPPPRQARRWSEGKSGRAGDLDGDEEHFEKAAEYVKIEELPLDAEGPHFATFSANQRPGTASKFCRKLGGVWKAKSSAGWIEVPHPPPKKQLAFYFAGRPVSWSSPEEWQDTARRMVHVLRHTEPEGLLADGSLAVGRLASILPAHPEARLLEKALFSFDDSRRCYRFEIVVDLCDSPEHPKPELWIRATRKHSIPVVA